MKSLAAIHHLDHHCKESHLALEVTSILQLFQHAFINYPMPGLAMLSTNITVICFVTVLGIWIFRKESKSFNEWV